jgi:hypothetical protein
MSKLRLRRPRRTLQITSAYTPLVTDKYCVDSHLHDGDEAKFDGSVQGVCPDEHHAQDGDDRDVCACAVCGADWVLCLVGDCEKA